MMAAHLQSLDLDEPAWVRDNGASLGNDGEIPGSGEIKTEQTATPDALDPQTADGRARLRSPLRRDIPSDWIAGALTLSAAVDPCPGFKGSHWVRSFVAIVGFLTGPHAADAARLGWTAELLFGADPTAGAANVAACGALIVADRQPVQSIEPDAIRFPRTTYYRPRSPVASLPVWSFVQ